LVASYNIRPGIGAGLFSKEKVSKEKVKKKRTSAEVYDVNKQTIHIASNSTNIKGALLHGSRTGPRKGVLLSVCLLSDTSNLIPY